jgi:hypothetical protein
MRVILQEEKLNVLYFIYWRTEELRKAIYESKLVCSIANQFTKI